jgi:hypothetical protein
MLNNIVRLYILSCLCFIFLGLLAGCNRNSLSPVKLKAWVEDQKNGLKQTAIKANYTFTLQYTPPDYMVVMDKKTKDILQSDYEEALLKFKGLVNFNLTILDKNSPLSFEGDAGISGAEYHNFGIQQDFKLVTGNDTLPCAMYQYESHGGISPDKMLVAFENKDDKYLKGFSFLYNDKILKTGPVVFNYRPETLISIPKLKTR